VYFHEVFEAHWKHEKSAHCLFRMGRSIVLVMSSPLSSSEQVKRGMMKGTETGDSRTFFFQMLRSKAVFLMAT
jgi:hypothetical protein